MPRRTLASARGAHSDKAAGTNPNKRLAGLNIRTVPQRMTAQNEPSAPEEDPEEDPEEGPREGPEEELEEVHEEEAEEQPAAKKRKTTTAVGGKRKRASDDDGEEDAEDPEESEPDERPKKEAKTAANKKASKGKSPKGKKKKKVSNNKAKEPEQKPYDPDRLWGVRDIIAEERDDDGQLWYLVDWEDDEETGEKYDPSWQVAENVVDTSPELLAEWEERRNQRESTEEEVSAEAIDPDGIEMEDVPEEEMPGEEERREIVQGRSRAGPKPRTQSKYPRKNLVAMTAPK